MKNIQERYEELLLPSGNLINDIVQIDGDILILGVGGKMGPALALLAKKAIEKAGLNKKVIGVSRFSEPGLQEQLIAAGIETIAADLLDDEQLMRLPDVKNILYLAGTKFGTSGKESFTWAMNAYLPGRVAYKFRNSRIVVFSTGNVYPLTPVGLGGATENERPQPIGEYAQSCLGRERIFQYSSLKYKTPILIYRLNYANDTSYGVLLEIARAVTAGIPIDLGMGNVNIIWQGDANEIAIRSLLQCTTGGKTLNVTGPETLSVRWIAKEFGKLFDKVPVFVGDEESTALLSNASECCNLFGYPRVSPKQAMELIAEWVKQNGKTLNKDTHFQERNGQF